MQAKRGRNRAFSLLMFEVDIAVIMCTDEILPEGDVRGHCDVWPRMHGDIYGEQVSLAVPKAPSWS